jgi:large subunit ribosomal protein L9
MPKRKTENATIEVILLAADKHLGEKYEKVRVKPIFAKNVLLPHNKAVLATPMNINNYRQKMESAQKEIAKKAADLKDLFAKIDEANGLLFVVKVNDEGHLYGKIDENDIAKKIYEEYKIDVPSHLFKLKKKIAEVGTYKVAFLYKEMKADVTIIVQAETPVKAKKVEAEKATEEVVEESTDE